MIKQQRKTNALLRARTQPVSASLAPARTRTRPVQQSQHHARSGGSRLKNETPPITELNQQRASMKSPALATPCPLALRSVAACTRTGTGTRARSRPAPSLPRALHAAPAAPAGSASASRSEKSPSPSAERLGGAYAPRTQLQRAQIRGDDAGAHIAVAVRRPEGVRLK